jgi:hypothetical protein
MTSFVNLAGPPDPTAARQQSGCGSLLAQPLPERGGTLRLGASDCGCGCQDRGVGSGPHGYQPPGDGTEGVEDDYLCAG